MFGRLTRERPQRQCPARRWVHLQVERLEARDCPAAPVITSFHATLLVGRGVELSGMVTDSNPASVQVTFGGEASGSVSANAQGNFDYTTEAAALGAISAIGVDGQSLVSNTALVTISCPAPGITLAIGYGQQTTVYLSGRVTAENPGGLTVNFTGKVVATTTTNSDGTFALSAQASGLGTIQVTTTDAWGQVSNTAQVTVTSKAPVISNFTAVQGTNGYWTFSGTVTDESAAGLTVTFTGLPAVQGQTTKVNADGTFSLIVQIPSNQNGWVSAQTTDWWGLQSNIVTTWI